MTTAEGRQTKFTWDSAKVASVNRVVTNSTGAGDAAGVHLGAGPGQHQRRRLRADHRPAGQQHAQDGRRLLADQEDRGPARPQPLEVLGTGQRHRHRHGRDGRLPEDGNVTSYTYDSAFNPTTVTLPTGASATSTWVKKGSGYFPETATSASSDKTANGYDTSGNLLTSTDSTTGGTGAKWTYDYNPRTGAMDCGGLPASGAAPRPGPEDVLHLRLEGQPDQGHPAVR
ncbi:hypothetical protein SCALM49S_09161 [Streptomyces californicus]